MMMRIAARLVVALALGTAWLAPISAAAQRPPAPAGVEDACRVLRSDAVVRAQFPGALERLCTPGFPVEQTCAARTPQACAADASCSVVMTFVCDRPPCPPGGPARASCAAAPVRPLVASIARYPLCVGSGGAWVPLPGWPPAQPMSSVCSCMGPSADAIVFTRTGAMTGALRSPLTYFVQGRGCVAETALCKEHNGTWVPRPADNPLRGRCEIAGKAAIWTQRERIGFEE